MLVECSSVLKELQVAPRKSFFVGSKYLAITVGRFGCHAKDNSYQRIGVVMNEMNRSVGLTDLVPQVFVSPVVDKLAHVHRLMTGAAGETVAAPATESSAFRVSGSGR